MGQAINADEACRILDVSRETKERLKAFVAVLKRWQKSINLVSRSTLDEVWGRHILDCGQVYRHITDTDADVMDIGSGAGLPGLILAIMAAEKAAGGEAARPVTLVESDERKCAFLSVAAREVGVSVTVCNKRIEELAPGAPGVITARALAPLEKLLEWTASQHHPGLECLFMKGANHAGELTCLVNYPSIRPKIIPSLSSPEGVIIRLTGFDISE